MKPRYYSISSSALMDKKRISITAVVESTSFSDSPHYFKGVATNYLLALKFKKQELFAFADQLLSNDILQSCTHKLNGPRGRFEQAAALIHVRRSKFRLPYSPSTPIIMVGPGTGVAPFRGFIRERVTQAQLGRSVAKTILFYGCRKADGDFPYKDKWDVSYS